MRASTTVADGRGLGVNCEDVRAHCGVRLVAVPGVWGRRERSPTRPDRHADANDCDGKSYGDFRAGRSYEYAHASGDGDDRIRSHARSDSRPDRIADRVRVWVVVGAHSRADGDRRSDYISLPRARLCRPSTDAGSSRRVGAGAARTYSRAGARRFERVDQF